MLEYLLSLEAFIVNKFSWPEWALRSLATLISIVLVLFIGEFLVNRPTKDDKQKIQVNQTASLPFRWFQLQYLTVYLITMLADWLQGTNMYTLYASYKVDIGTLFITGFLSSALFGTFLGVYVDRWGRKFGCLLFCVLEIVINLLEHIPSMPVLLIGRVLGGLSTSLLFSTFESWMVAEHRKRNFPEELLASTFAISSWGNGIVAIFAGFLAQASSDVAGDIGPFQLAIALTIITTFFILFWSENYGQSSGQNTSLMSDVKQAYNYIIKRPEVLCLGLSQALFEGAMYTFVFLWVPTLLTVNTGSLPTGLVFSCFMLALTIGGKLFSLLLNIFPGGAEGLSVFVYILAACAMLIPIYSYEFWSILIGFLVFESAVGIFNSCSGTLRSKYYPDAMQSSIMSVFRLPLNLLVVGGTRLSAIASTDINELKFVFGILAGVHMIALFLHLLLIHKARQQQIKNKLK